MQIETMTYNDRHRINQTMTVDEKEKSLRFAFLIISANPHLAHLQSHTYQPHNQNFAKEPNFAHTQH